MVLNPTIQTRSRRDFDVVFPQNVVKLIEQKIDAQDLKEPLILVNASQLKAYEKRSSPEEIITKERCIISLQRLNDIRFVNKFLEGLNESLFPGGYVVVQLEPSCARKDRIISRFKWPLGNIIYFFDYWIKRVWPKLPILKFLYFFLMGSRNRVITEMESIGRLYSCGFHLVESLFESGKLFLIAKKGAAPDYNEDATYGPIIKLKRVGRHGKPIKVYKFRTMFAYSEYLQQFIYEQQGLQSGGKIKDDPRVNKLGHFLRKYWLDEIPMLFNFLKGDLKLFGVRPISSHYFSLFPSEFQAFRQKFKPGLIPPVYVEIPETLEDVIAIERRYLEAYERNPWVTDINYTYRALYNIFIKRVRSK